MGKNTGVLALNEKSSQVAFPWVIMDIQVEGTPEKVLLLLCLFL